MTIEIVAGEFGVLFADVRRAYEFTPGSYTMSAYQSALKFREWLDRRCADNSEERALLLAAAIEVGL